MRDRIDALITRERIRNYSAIFVLLSFAALLLSALLGDFPLTATGSVFLPDYLAHWTGGRMVLEGRAGSLYDPAVQSGLQQMMVPGVDGLSWFVGPPFSALIYVPFALIPYGLSTLAWTSLSLALLVASVRMTLPLLPRSRRADAKLFVLVSAALPWTFELVGSGQDSALALFLWVSALRLLMAGKGFAAGATLGLALFKPQLLVFVPILLLAQRQHRALAGFASVAAALLAVSVALVGVGGIRDWILALGSPLYQEQVQVGQAWKMQSISAFSTWLGGSELISYAVLGLGAVLLAWFLTRSELAIADAWALTALATVVFSPHVVSYDLVILVPATAAGIWLFENRDVRLLALAVFVLGWTIGVRHAIGLQTGWPWRLIDAPWTAIPLTALWVVMVREMLNRPRARAPAT